MASNRRKRYAVETRHRSTRTESGWTKWTQYVVFHYRADAERAVAGLRSWMDAYDGEARIVDRHSGTVWP